MLANYKPLHNCYLTQKVVLIEVDTLGVDMHFESGHSDESSLSCLARFPAEEHK